PAPGAGLMGAKAPAPPMAPPRPPSGGEEQGMDSDPAKDPNAIVQPLAERLLAEIRRSLEYYTSQEDGVAVSKIYITGGAMRLNGLKEFLSARLNLEVIELDTFGSAKVPESAMSNPAIYQSAFGLALTLLSTENITLNLLPSDLYAQIAMSSRVVWKQYASVLGIILICEVGTFLWFTYNNMKTALAELTAEYEGQVKINGQPLIIDDKPVLNKDVLARMSEMQKRRDQLDERFKAINELEVSKYDWIAIMESVRKAIPENVWITDQTLVWTPAGFTLHLKTNVEENARICYKNIQSSACLTYSGTGINLQRTKEDKVDYWSWDAPITFKFQPLGSADEMESAE
ncbi:TPA: hypothetical protein DEF17_07440, partial [bacterium]|nr:hypothetical protein [bacterium]